jgi:hypothetical protein
MAAIEYGSYYWCVVLNGKDAEAPGESVHLHADDLSIDPTGSLTFRSAGRRPAGAEPNQHNGQQDGKDSDKDSKDDKGKRDDDQNSKQNSMIYVAFAPGTWKLVYAAKLQDGSPASVEHWNASGSAGVRGVARPDSGATGYTPRE